MKIDQNRFSVTTILRYKYYFESFLFIYYLPQVDRHKISKRNCLAESEFLAKQRRQHCLY